MAQQLHALSRIWSSAFVQIREIRGQKTLNARPARTPNATYPMHLYRILARAATAVLALSLASIAAARGPGEIEPLLVGAVVPDVEILSESGETIPLRSLTKGNRTAIVFYRGGWCPFCVRQLQGLAEARAALEELGFQIVAIGADSPEKLSTAEQEGALDLALYADPTLAAADAFGISFTLSPTLLRRYRRYGIDLAEASGGANSDRLPVPA